MKKLRILMSLVVAFTGCFTSISAQKTFRVFKHDGSLNVFLYSNIDSITYSNMDENGMLQDYVVTQNIHTSDSVYRFNVNEIDSVAFTQLPTVYKPDAIRIEGRLRDYVVGADSLTLFLKKSIPESLLPKPGDNLATLECDDVLPYGFFGKVERITQAAETINVECTQAALTDIYESLELVISTDGDGKAKSRSPENPSHHSLTIPSLKGSIDLKNEINAAGGFSGTYGMNAFVELSTEQCDVNWMLNIVPRAFKVPQVYCSFTYTAQNTLRIGSSLSAEVAWNKEFPIEAIRNIRIPGAAGVFELFEEGGIFVNIAGSIGLEGSFSKPFTTVIHFSYDNSADVSIPPTFKMIGREATTETTLEGEASISVGLYGKIGVGAFVKEMANIEAGLKVGTTFSSSLSLMPGPTPIEVPNTEMYDEMNQDDFFRGDLTLTGEVAAKILNDTKLGGSLEVGDMLFKNPFFQRGIVPHFNEVSLTECEKAGVMTANATLNRKLMFDTPVGFALYDSDKKLVDSWWSPTKYKDKEGEKISHDFENLKANEEYTVHPITRAMKDNMVANPSNKSRIMSVVTTGSALGVTENKARLHGLIGGVSEADDYSCGFYYGTDPSVKEQNCEFISASLQEKSSFVATLDNLQPETKYYYRAVSTVNGKTIVADETKSFKTGKKATEIDLSGTDIWISPRTVFFSFPNVTSYDQASGTYVSISLNQDMSEIVKEGRIYYREDAPQGYIAEINGLKPSTTHWYKIYNYYLPENYITGSFTTTPRINVSTPVVDCNFNPYDDNVSVSHSIRNEYGAEIGAVIRDVAVKFESPDIISGVSSDAFIDDLISHVGSVTHGGKPEKGIIYSDSPDNLTFLSSNLLGIEFDYETETFCRTQRLKPGTYYYRAYYKDTTCCRVLHKDDGTRVLLGPDGEELGDASYFGSTEATRKMEHLSSYYGEIQEFTIPEAIYFK